MKIKSKLMLGLWFLFLMILLMGLAGTRYIYKIGQDSKSILKDNYRSIKYAKDMTKELDGMTSPDLVKAKQAESLFGKNLHLQENNITEVGEKETVEQLRADFENYRKSPTSLVLASSIRAQLYKISELNMAALEQRNGMVQNKTENAVISVSLLLAVCIMACFSIIFNIPENMK